MPNQFITSDLHIKHYTLHKAIRGFNSDDLIIENWNKVVKNKHDRVYVLGDFCMQKPSVIREAVPKLHGEIIIVGGNHDTLNCSREFMRQGIPVVGCLNLHHYLLTHVPIHPSQIEFGIIGNVHGHIHNNGHFQEGDYIPHVINDPRYFNANIEMHNYELWPVEEIDQYFKNL